MSQIGDDLARLRRRAGFTQEQLAERAGVSVSIIQKLERHERDSAAFSTLRRLAGALGTPTITLLPARTPEPGEGPDLLHLRRALLPAQTYALPTSAEDEPTLAAAGGSARAVHEMLRDNGYERVIAALPSAIGYGLLAAEGLDGADQSAAWGHLAQVYQSAAMVLIQLVQLDLAHHAIGQAAAAARRAGDPVALAGVACTENWLLTVEERLDEAEHVALAAARDIEPPLTGADPAQYAAYGWANLGVAAAAVRNARPDAASEAMARARAVAHLAAPRTPHVETRHWSTFSPAVAAMRTAELAAVNGDPAGVLRVAAGVPGDARPRVTWQRHRLDVAAALIETRRHDDATAVLTDLRDRAPGWMRHQVLARAATMRLVDARRRAPDPVRDLARWLRIEDYPTAGYFE